MKIFRMNKYDYVAHNSYDEAVEFYMDITLSSDEIYYDYKNEKIELNEFKINTNPEIFEPPILMTVEESIKKRKSELPAIFFGRF